MILLSYNIFFDKDICSQLNCHWKHIYNVYKAKNYDAKIFKKVNIVESQAKRRFGEKSIKIDSILINIVNLLSFLSNFKGLLITTRLNTSVLFKLIDLFKPKLFFSPSLFIINAWLTFFFSYWDQTLRLHLIILLYFISLIGYQ